jgi:bla regulator protein blaR1
MNGLFWLLETALECGVFGLRQAFAATLPAALLLAAVLTVSAALPRWLSAGQKCLLWGLVLLRLLIPIAPASFLSLENVLGAAPLNKGTAQSVSRNAGEIFFPAEEPQSTIAASDRGYSQAGDERPMAPQSPDWSAIEFLSMVLPLVWLASVVANLAWTLIGHWRLCRRVAQIGPSQDDRLRGLWAECRRQAAIGRQIPIVLFDGIGQPALLGWLWPKLLLPRVSAELSDDQLRMVMLHELAHVRRWDIAANWLLALVRAVHWWNPVYWIAAARYRALREQACDAWVIGRTGTESVRDYGELLLAFAEGQRSGTPWRVTLPASLLGFHPTLLHRRALHNRIEALRLAGRSRGRWEMVAAMGLLLLIMIAGLTDASSPPPPVDPHGWLPQAGHGWAVASAVVEKFEPGPMLTRQYDIQEALEQFAVQPGPPEFARRQLEWQVTSLLNLAELNRASARGAVSDDERERLLKVIPLAKNATIDGNTLTVCETAEVHAEIARNLEAWAQSGLGQTSICIRSCFTDRDIVQGTGVSWQYLEASPVDRNEEMAPETRSGAPVVRAQAVSEDFLPVIVAALDEQQTLEIAAAAAGAGAGQTSSWLRSPKVTMNNGQQATVADSTQTPFVVGISETAHGVEEPKVAVIKEGTKLTVRAIQSRDQKTVHLQGCVEFRTLGDVYEVPTLVHGERSAIQIPRARRGRIDFSADVADGQSLLVGCVPSLDEKRFCYMLLTPNVIVEPNEAAP